MARACSRDRLYPRLLRSRSVAIPGPGAIPVLFCLEEPYDRHAPRHGMTEDEVRIDANELAIVVAITVTGACPAGLDITHDWASIAADGIIGHGSLGISRQRAPQARGRGWPGVFECVPRWRREWHSGSREQSG